MTATETSNLLTDREFEEISDLVYSHCGINLHDGKKELVRARLSKQLRVSGCATVSQYMRRVSADPNEFSNLIDSISTNLTSFFRESAHFDFLREKFLPALVERKTRAGDRRIRAWSAGCSTGEEPYTLAITLLESIPGGQSWDVKVLATDISHRVLKIAEAGSYDAARLESVPPQLRSRYFTTARTGAMNRPTGVASNELKSLIRFRHLNLMETWPFSGPFDFIFCRNVMIYFDKPTQQKLVGRYREVLEPGGMLFTGHSESLTGISHNFQYVQPTIYRKA